MSDIPNRPRSWIAILAVSICLPRCKIRELSRVAKLFIYWFLNVLFYSKLINIGNIEPLLKKISKLEILSPLLSQVVQSSLSNVPFAFRTARWSAISFLSFFLVGQSPPRSQQGCVGQWKVHATGIHNPGDRPIALSLYQIQDEEGSMKEESGAFWKSASTIPSHEYQRQSRALAIVIGGLFRRGLFRHLGIFLRSNEFSESSLSSQPDFQKENISWKRKSDILYPETYDLKRIITRDTTERKRKTSVARSAAYELFASNSMELKVKLSNERRHLAFLYSNIKPRNINRKFLIADRFKPNFLWIF